MRQRKKTIDRIRSPRTDPPGLWGAVYPHGHALQPRIDRLAQLRKVSFIPGPRLVASSAHVFGKGSNPSKPHAFFTLFNCVFHSLVSLMFTSVD